MSRPRERIPLRRFVPGLLASLACGCGSDRPVIAVVSTTEFVDAAVLALEPGMTAEGSFRIDTVMVRESPNLPTVAVHTALELVDVPRLLAVIGHSNSEASLAASPVYNSARVVQIAPTSSAPSYSEAGPFSFRLAPSDAGQGLFLARRIAASHPQGAELAILYVNDAYGRGLRSALLEHLDTVAHKIRLDLPHAEEDTSDEDVARMLGALDVARPDLIVWLSRPVLLDLALPGIRGTLGDVPILGGDGLSGGMGEHGPLWRGVEYVELVDLTGSDAIRGFREHYRERFGREAGGAEALTFDAMTLLLSGLAAGARDGEAMRAYLMSLGRERPAWEGVTGPIEFDENGDVERSYVMMTVGQGVSR